VAEGNCIGSAFGRELRAARDNDDSDLRQELARAFYNRDCMSAVIWRTQPYHHCPIRQETFFFFESLRGIIRSIAV
jgi:hypothetical protein